MILYIVIKVLQLKVNIIIIKKITKNNCVLLCKLYYPLIIMELLKTEYSKSKGNGKLDKVLLKCMGTSILFIN